MLTSCDQLRGWRLWWRNRSLNVTLAVMIVCMAWIAAASGLVIEVPSLIFSSGVEVPNGALIPLLTAITHGYGLSRQDVHLEHAGSRQTQAADVFSALVLVVIMGLGTVVLFPVLGASRHLGIIATRNLAGFLGLGLLTRTVSARPSPSMPAVIVTLTSLFTSSPRPWAVLWSWPTDRYDNIPAAIVTGFILLLGSATYSYRGRTGKHSGKPDASC